MKMKRGNGFGILGLIITIAIVALLAWGINFYASEYEEYQDLTPKEKIDLIDDAESIKSDIQDRNARQIRDSIEINQ